jgi:hypothetical protein
MKEWGKGIGREYLLPSSHMKVATPAGKTFVGASLLVAHDEQTERWTVSLVSRTSREDVIVAWKQSEADALAWAANYGVRK